jgi:crotonobetainyl-CoA:carnitine CoA-transferase CaiB-like acyl-CoA transferase
MSQPPQQPPLAGIKVVDLTRYLAGPFCTQILGDYGAEIFKIEPVENPRGELGDSGDGKRTDNYFFSFGKSIQEKYPRRDQGTGRPRNPHAPH